MYKSLKRVVLLFALVCAFASLSLFAVACNPEENSDKVTYSVTVTSEDTNLSLTSIKAQWMNGETAASDEITLDAEGKASVELTAGDYTVTLKGVPAGYTFDAASVTAENREAAIEIRREAPGEARIIITFNLPEGVTELPEGVKVQLYKGETGTEKAGDPVNVDGKSKTATISRFARSADTYRVEVEGLPNYLSYTAATFKPDKSAVEVSVSTALANVAYTVTVNANAYVTEEEVNEGKITFYKGETAVEGATDLTITDKKATVTIVAGNYDVKFTHENASLEADPVQVTITEQTATVEVKANVYDITVTKAENVSLAVTDITVQLKGEKTYSAQCGADGVAHIRAPKGAYTATVSGTGIGSFPASVTAQEKTATLRAVAFLNVRTISAAGEYLVEFNISSGSGGSREGATQRFTIAKPETGQQVEISWVKDNPSNTVTIYNKGTSALQGESSVTFNVGPGFAESNYFELSYVTEVFGTYYIIFTVEYEPLPDRGRTQGYPLELQEGDNTATEGWFEVWYLLPNPFPSHQITFGQGIMAEFIDYQGVQRRLANGAYFSRQGSASTALEYLHLTSQDVQITFKVEEKEEPGSTPQNAEAMELDRGFYSHYFENDNDWYYTFTPTETAEYAIEFEDGNTERYVTIYKGLVENDDPSIRVAYEMTSLGHVKLEAEQQYLVKLGHRINETLTFKLVKFEAGEGQSKSNPIEAANVGTAENSVTTITAEDPMYLYHTITAESLDAAGNVVFEFSCAGSLKAYFYDDSEYSNQINYNDLAKKVTITGMQAGQTIYFTLRSTLKEDTITFTINKPADMLEVGKPLTLTLTGSQYNFFNREIQLLNVPAGKYTLSVSSTDQTDLSAPVEFQFDGVKKCQTSGKFTFTSAAFELGSDVKIMKIYTTTWFPTSPVEVTITLNKVIELTLDTPLKLPVTAPSYDAFNMDVALSGVPEGTYTLTLTFGAKAYDMYTFSAGAEELNLGSFMGGTEFSGELKVASGCDKLHVTCQGPQATDVTIKLTAATEQGYKYTIQLDTLLDNVECGFGKDNGAKIGLDEAVTPGDYTLTLSNHDSSKNYGVFVCGDSDEEVSFSGNVATITIKADTKYLIVCNYAFGSTTTVSLTLSKKSAAIEPAKTYELSVGVPLEVTFTPDGSNKVKAELRLNDVAPGAYTLKFENCSSGVALSSAWNISYNDESNPEELWNFIGYEEPVAITIPQDCTKIFLLPESGSAIEYNVTITLNASGSVVPQPQEGDLKVGVESSIELPADGSGEVTKTIWLDAGDYVLTIADDSESRVAVFEESYTLGSGGQLLEPSDPGEDRTAMFSVETAKLYTLTIGDSQYQGGFTIKLTISVSVPAPEGDIKVGEDATVVIPGSEVFYVISKTVYLEAGSYEITISGEGIEGIQVNDPDNKVSEDGTLLAAGTTTKTFTVSETGMITLKFVDTGSTGGQSVTVRIEARRV